MGCFNDFLNKSVLDEGMVEVSYYLNQMKRTLPADDTGVTIQLISSNGKSNNLNLNRDTAIAFNKFIESIKDLDWFKK